MFNIRVTWFYMPLMTDTPIDEFYWSLSIYYLDFNMFDSKFWTMRSWAEKKRKIMPVLKYRHESEPVDLVLIVVFHDATQDFMPPWSWATQHSHGQLDDLQIDLWRTIFLVEIFLKIFLQKPTLTSSSKLAWTLSKLAKQLFQKTYDIVY